jgi:hypothetical protein
MRFASRLEQNEWRSRSLPSRPKDDEKAQEEA